MKGKAALICAGSKGLGRACAAALAREGADIVLVARGIEALEQTAAELRTMGANVVPVSADITTPHGREAALQGAAQLAYREAAAFDIVVTNAGGPLPRDFRELEVSDWQDALLANMLTPIELMRATVDGMARRGWGRIVNITSTTVKAPSTYLPLSNGSRSGLTGFVAGLARQVAADGVTVNNLLPGTFETGRLTSNLRAGAVQAGAPHEDYVQSRRDAIPSRRFGDPDEFGAACAFLCSVHGGYITGQNLLIDGGAYPGVL
nr:SDR family oxidoreductase [Variibacter gotjawalensis]